MSNLALIDDRDPAHVTYTGSWLNGTSFPYFDGTTSGGRQLGSTATVRFIGTTLSLYSTNSPGNASCSVSIDGGSQTSHFEVNRDGWQDHTLFWQSEVLSDDEHEVVFTIAEDVPNPVLYFDYFTYTVSSKTPMENVTLYVDSEDSQVQYSGNWTEHPTNHYMFSGTSRKSESEGESFTYEFEGVGVSFYGQIDHDQSTFTEPIITLDGQVQEFTLPTRERSEIDPEDPWWNSNYFSIDSLESKKHTLVVSAGNDRPVWLDYILVKPGAPPSADNTSSTLGISPGAITGAVVGAVAGLALIVGLFVIWWRRGRARADIQDGYEYHEDISEARAFGPSIEPYIVPFYGHLTPGHEVGEMRKGSHPDFSNSSVNTPRVAETSASGSSTLDVAPERQNPAVDALGQPYEDSGYRFNAANPGQTRPPPLYTPE